MGDEPLDDDELADRMMPIEESEYPEADFGGYDDLAPELAAGATSPTADADQQAASAGADQAPSPADTEIAAGLDDEAAAIAEAMNTVVETDVFDPLAVGSDSSQIFIQHPMMVGMTPLPEPPHDVANERSVLGALLANTAQVTTIHDVRAVLATPLPFYVQAHRIIYAAILTIDDLVGEESRISLAAVVEYLRNVRMRALLDRIRQLEFSSERSSGGWRQRQFGERVPESQTALDGIGGEGVFGDILREHASAQGLEDRVLAIWDAYLRRQMIQHYRRVAEEAYLTTDSPEVLLDSCSQRMLDLGRSQSSLRVYGMDEVVDEAMEAMRNPDVDDAAANPVFTGFPTIDEMLLSLRPGGLYVIAARPGAGKTSFALAVARNVVAPEHDEMQQGQGVLLFSLEVDRVDLVQKIVCGMSDISFEQIEAGLSDADQERMLPDVEEFGSWPLSIMDESDLTVQALRGIVQRQLMDNPALKLIIIDYLQLLGSVSSMSEYEKVSDISRGLKILARDLRIPVIALSQMSRDSEKGSEPRAPKLSDLRGSGAIEQDADAVIFLHRLPAEADAGGGLQVEVKVAKNRFGQIGDVPMRFFPKKQKFIEIPKERF